MNKVILIGRLTRDIELKRTTNETAFVNFTVAINRRVASGQAPQADFINCVAWNRVAVIMSQYLHKGSQIAIEGRIQTRNYERDGNRVYVTEVVAEQVEFLGSRSGGSSSDYSASAFEEDNVIENSSNFDEAFSMDAFDASDDDLPF